MASILLVGADAALFEGIAQALIAAGHQAHTASSIAEATFVAAAAPPLVAVIDRTLLQSAADAHSVGLAAGGVLLAYGDPITPLAGPVRRAILAELRLPLERARLLAIVAHVQTRVQRTGRNAVTPPESRPGL